MNTLFGDFIIQIITGVHLSNLDKTLMALQDTEHTGFEQNTLSK